MGNICYLKMNFRALEILHEKNHYLFPGIGNPIYLARTAVKYLKFGIKARDVNFTRGKLG